MQEHSRDDDIHQPTNLHQKINTQGGTSVSGNVDTGGGDFVGRDKNIHIGPINISRYFSLFRDVKQLIVFILSTLIIGGGIVFGFEWSSQPRKMTGDFNIAIADFVETPLLPQRKAAPVVSQMLFGVLNDEYTPSFGDIQISHGKIGVIQGPVEAKELANRINADIVIYGSVNIVSDIVTILPAFYVADSIRFDVGQISGQTKLTNPIRFSLNEINDITSEKNIKFYQRATILIEFTKGLVYLASKDLDAALVSLENAIRRGQEFGNFDDGEVFYLFASHIARLKNDTQSAKKYVEQALALNSSYTRAYIAYANIYYDELDFDSALTYYKKALTTPEQTYGSYIIEKAHLGIGHIFSYRHQLPEELEKEQLAKEALDHYQIVIQAYESEDKPEFRLKELAAQAYYGSGIVYQGQKEYNKAIGVYKQTKNLTQDSDVKIKAQKRLEQICKFPCFLFFK